MKKETDNMTIGLQTPSTGYKPFRYPWAFDFWQTQQRIHWLPEEAPLGEDIKDWRARLNPEEKRLLTNVFRFFTQSDIDVNDNYMETLATQFKPTEVKMMLSAFSNMETIHVAAYSLLIETVGMSESEYTSFREIPEMVEKHAFAQNWKEDGRTGGDLLTLTNLAVFGAFTEGLQLFASFAMLMNFPRFGKMRGMGQIVTWSIRDETLHCQGITRLFRTMRSELGMDRDRDLQKMIQTACINTVQLEDAFIDLAFGEHSIDGLTADEMKSYIRYIADWRMRGLGYEPVFGQEVHPLPWLQEMIGGVEHANFFEARATEYSKVTTEGSWSDTWEHFDNG